MDAVDELNLDGVDLAMEEGCGTANFACGDETSMQLYLLEHLREELPDKVSTRYIFSKIILKSMGCS